MPFLETLKYLKVLLKGDTMVKKIKILKLKCKRCNHKWVPKQEIILVCPKCKSPYWDKEKIK